MKRLTPSQVQNSDSEINKEDDLIPINDLYYIQTGMKVFTVHKVNPTNAGPSPR